MLVNRGDVLSSMFTSIRELYEVIDIPNKIQDGTECYPLADHDPETGMSLEFK
jgi:hypothetical protein